MMLWKKAAYLQYLAYTTMFTDVIECYTSFPYGVTIEYRVGILIAKVTDYCFKISVSL